MKKFLKKAAASALAACMALSLAGCGMFGEKAPDPRELADKLASVNLSGCYDVSVAVSADVTEDGTHASVSVDADVESDGNVSHIEDLVLSFAMEGMSFRMTGEAWAEASSDTMYMNMSMLGQESGWTKSSMEDAEIDAGIAGDTARSLSGITPGKDAEPVLGEHEKGQDWSVSWEADPADVKGLLDGMSDLSEGSGTVESVQVTATFGEEDLEPKSVTVRAEGEGMSLTANVTFNSLGGKTALEIPAEIIETAVDGTIIDTEIDSGFSYGGDTGTDTPDDDGEWMHMSEDGYMTDGDGYDGVIDPMAKAAAGRTDGGNVRVVHYSGWSEMTIDHESGGISGSISVRDFSWSEWTDAAGEFANECSFYDGWYDADQKAVDQDGYALWIKPDEMDGARVYGDMLVCVSGYSLDDTDQASFEAFISEMAGIAGVDW